MCRQLGIKKHFSTAYRPQSQGCVERANKPITDTLTMYVSENQNDWSHYLPYIRFALNTSIHSSTNETPYYLTFVKDPILPYCLGLQPPNPLTAHPDDYSKTVAMRLHQAMTIADIALSKAQSNYKSNYDKTAHEPPLFTIGTRVWLYYPVTKPGLSKKMAFTWQGPYRILDKKGKNYQIRLESNPNSKVDWVHVDKLKLFKDRNIVLAPNAVQLANDDLVTVHTANADTLTKNIQDNTLSKSKRDQPQTELQSPTNNNTAKHQTSKDSNLPQNNIPLRRLGLRPRENIKVPKRLLPL